MSGPCLSPVGDVADDEAHARFLEGNHAAAFRCLHQGRCSRMPGAVLPTFSPDFALETMASAIPHDAIFLSLLAGSQGGGALALLPGTGRLTALSLPGLTSHSIDALISGSAAAPIQQHSLGNGYRRLERRLGGRRILKGDEWREWDRTLRAVLTQLARTAWQGIHRWLRDTLQLPTGTEVILSVPPALSALPFAAVLEPETGRHFVDDFAVSQIPHAGWLIHCQQRARSAESQPPAMLAVLDPGGDLALDPAWALRFWQWEPNRCEVLAGGSATVSRVLARLPSCTHYLHFGHGSRRRRRSVLELAAETGNPSGMASLDDAQVRGISLIGHRLSILAACESGLPADKHPTGLNGMAGSFLLAGAACAIGCLWPVESSATRHLVEGVLLAHLGGESSARRLRPAQALRVAQLRLREHQPSLARVGQRSSLLHLRPGGSLPVCSGRPGNRELFCWAAFTCLGT